MKLALCNEVLGNEVLGNEVLGDMPFAKQCDFSAALGYQGLELAPYTVDPEPHLMSAEQRKTLRRAGLEAGTPIVGLHWLLVTPKGLSITTDDKAVRERTIDVMRRLIGLCADLGGEYLVHGSPGQRRLPDDGMGAEEAAKRGAEAWATIAEDATKAGVVYCIEALALPEANFVNTVEEAAAIVDQINQPGLKTMVDCCSAAVSEQVPIAALIDRWLPSGYMAHIQVNDRNRRGPGQGKDEFETVIAALKRHQYKGWVAVEPFVYKPDGPATAAFCAGYMQALIDTSG